MLREFSSRFRRAALAYAVAAAFGAAPLAACGVKGPLKPAQPPAPTAGALPSEPPSMPAQELPQRKP